MIVITLAKVYWPNVLPQESEKMFEARIEKKNQIFQGIRVGAIRKLFEQMSTVLKRQRSELETPLVTEEEAKLRPYFAWEGNHK